MLGKPSALLEQGRGLTWADAYNFVNPFSDRRGGLFNSI